MNAMTVHQAAGQLSATFATPQVRGQIAAMMGVAANDQVIDRFTRVVMRAVQEDPKLLDADRNSLFLACQAAAQDKLIPDGREGKLVVYNVKDGDRWISKVQWQRMVGGIRRMAAAYGFDIVAEVVCQNDHFRVVKGLNPTIEHDAAPLDKEPGDIIGVYAIATHMETGRKYFEVMRKSEVDHIAQASKSKDKNGNLVGPWRDYYGEQARKTVVKRLFKSLPLVDADDVRAVIERDNEEYSMSPVEPEPTPAAPPSKERKPRVYAKVVEAEPSPAAGDIEDAPPADDPLG